MKNIYCISPALATKHIESPFQVSAPKGPHPNGARYSQFLNIASELSLVLRDATFDFSLAQVLTLRLLDWTISLSLSTCPPQSQCQHFSPTQYKTGVAQ